MSETTKTSKAPRYATMKDYYRAQLLGGPDSGRLEFSTDYYVNETGPVSYRPFTLAEFLVKIAQQPSRYDIDEVKMWSANSAATIALAFFHTDEEVYDTVDSYRGFEYFYGNATRLAVEAYDEAGRPDGVERDALIAGLPFREGAHISIDNQREASRLAIQHLDVYRTLVTTGEVPLL